MKEDLDKVKLLARDFRGDRASPRSPREQLGGYALAARALDKCRATLVGWQGDYFSNCPLDQRWLKFAELEYDAFRSLVATGATDEEIAGWIKTTRKTGRRPKSPNGTNGREPYNSVSDRDETQAAGQDSFGRTIARSVSNRRKRRSAIWQSSQIGTGILSRFRRGKLIELSAS